MDNKMIEELKENWKPWIELGEDERHVLLNNKQDLQYWEFPFWVEMSHSRIIPDGMVVRLRPDFEEVKKRWFFHPHSHIVDSTGSLIIGGDKSRTDAEWFNKCGYIEVQECDLPYLEKPNPVDGFEWVFKKPEKGDVFLTSIFGEVTAAMDGAHDGRNDWFLQGYRWVKVAKEKQGMGQKDIQNCPNGFVEYPIYQEYGYNKCNVKHDKHGDGVSLSFLPAYVGFAGVQFEGQSAINHWSMTLSAFIGKNGGLQSRSNMNTKPATPIRARFWVT